MRAAPREIAAQIVQAVTDGTAQPVLAGWFRPCEVARVLGLTESQVRASVKYASREYGAFVRARSGHNFRITPDGVARWRRIERSYHLEGLFAEERARVARGETPWHGAHALVEAVA